MKGKIHSSQVYMAKGSLLKGKLSRKALVGIELWMNIVIIILKIKKELFVQKEKL